MASDLTLYHGLVVEDEVETKIIQKAMRPPQTTLIVEEMNTPQEQKSLINKE
jgi:hypothetical protein